MVANDVIMFAKIGQTLKKGPLLFTTDQYKYIQLDHVQELTSEELF